MDAGLPEQVWIGGSGARQHHGELLDQQDVDRRPIPRRPSRKERAWAGRCAAWKMDDSSVKAE
jgi:hypothetical protein